MSTLIVVRLVCDPSRAHLCDYMAIWYSAHMILVRLVKAELSLAMQLA